MFDTSIFNFIYDHNLVGQVELFFLQNRNILVYTIQTQLHEINAMHNNVKKQRIIEMMQVICPKLIPMSLAPAGTTKYTSHGFKGATIPYAKVVNIDESKPEEIEKLRGSIKENPIGEHMADTTILDTAITENMDCLVTADIYMKTQLPHRLRNVRIYSQKHSELKIERIQKKDDLLDFLKKLV
jgi:hypothetical protein